MKSDSSSAVVEETEAKPAEVRKTGKNNGILFVGLDLGTNTSFILSGNENSSDYNVSKLLPSVVGYVRDGLVNGILPSNDEIFYGEDAIQNKLHLDLVWPLKDGVINNVKATRDLLRHMREMVAPDGAGEIRAVIGMPANTSAQSKEVLRSAVTGVFDRILIIPEPFLAALGYREDSRLHEPHYVDPVQNSLFVDIGAGTTDLCLVQGYFPKKEDELSFPYAGDSIDDAITKGLEHIYPDMKLSLLQIREMKEAHSYVGPSRRPIDVKVVVNGKTQTIEIADTVGNACNQLLDRIFESVKELITRAPSESVVTLLQNILVTGGGSRIKGIDTELQKMLVEEGYANPRVRTVGEDYKRFVGLGAIKAARAARDTQWQILFK
ncbi:rod shape-determining protein [Coraliomargarita parva]|uniref:rod shape-determining protein n=1 Tax=Coraliomargarita parva TaxID=3014050 RepID=UPI0022B3FDB5|nr:rod shape-determining protein [Coraliomargarita parva]